MGVFRSSNMGLSWEETNEGLDNLMITCLNGNSKGDIFSGSMWGGMHKSSDRGKTWFRIADEIDDYEIGGIEIDSKDRIFMWSAGWHISENDGIDWRWFPGPGGFPLAFSKDRDIVVSTEDAVIKYDSSLVKCDTLLVGTNIRAIAINDSNYIFAIENEGVQISKNFGLTWNRVEVQSNGKYVNFSLYISKSGSLFAKAYDIENWKNKLFRSDDNGATWTSSNPGLTGEFICSFTEDANGCIYAATSGAGVYRSCDNGNSWSPFNNGLKRMHIRSLYIDNKGYLYAGTDGGDNYKKSTTEGNKMSPGLNNFNYLESNLSDVIPGGYLFRIKTGVPYAVEIPKPVSRNFILEQNFPNPFSENSTIRFNLAQTENVSLKIYNSLGQIVLNPVNGRKEAGLHEVVLNGTEMPAGVYFYQLQTQKGSTERKFIVFK
jgi:hypothetical protein